MNISVDYRVIGVRKANRYASKRFFDVTVAAALLLLLGPLMLLLALLVVTTSKGSAIYRHKRVGLGGEDFEVYKFRTMVNGADKLRRAFTPEQEAEFKSTFKLRNDPRVTFFGKILRSTSLDELPQFINVIKGNMSVVGPRPVTREELAKYGGDARIFLSVKPGITGLWQISGRSDVSYEDRVKMDLSYIENRSLWLDIRIVLGTVGIVISRLGAY